MPATRPTNLGEINYDSDEYEELIEPISPSKRRVGEHGQTIPASGHQPHFIVDYNSILMASILLVCGWILPHGPNIQCIALHGQRHVSFPIR